MSEPHQHTQPLCCPLFQTLQPWTRPEDLEGGQLVSAPTLALGQVTLYRAVPHTMVLSDIVPTDSTSMGHMQKQSNLPIPLCHPAQFKNFSAFPTPDSSEVG